MSSARMDGRDVTGYLRRRDCTVGYIGMKLQGWIWGRDVGYPELKKSRQKKKDSKGYVKTSHEKRVCVSRCRLPQARLPHRGLEGAKRKLDTAWKLTQRFQRRFVVILMMPTSKSVHRLTEISLRRQKDKRKSNEGVLLPAQSTEQVKV